MKLLVLVILAGTVMVALSFSLTTEAGEMTALTSATYSVLVTLFLLAQVYGFIVSQVNYAEGVEEAKFSMLENEMRDPDLPPQEEGVRA